jgi:hypothetical protein
LTRIQNPFGERAKTIFHFDVTGKTVAMFTEDPPSGLKNGVVPVTCPEKVGTEGEKFCFIKYFYL